MNRLDFERPITELEKKINELKTLSTEKSGVDLSSEIDKLEKKLHKLKEDTFESLTPWQRIQIARHPKRPYSLDYINIIFTDFMSLHGDRLFAEDKAIVSGLAKIDNYKVMVMGHQKGRDINENVMRNFGCAHPEGYRKAIRLMRMAEKFHLPVIVFIDTPGAYPGIGAEERGQAHAIAENLREMVGIATPIICMVIGEGGSGGALGIGIGDKIGVLENAYYSVISPEGCAAILWKDSARAKDAAEALKLTAKDLLQLGLIDGEIKEPLGGAHRNATETAKNIKEFILKNLIELSELTEAELLKKRYNKFRNMGVIGA